MLAAGLFAASSSTAHAAEGAWQLKLGGEYDSNAARTTGDGVEGAFGTRLFGQVHGLVDVGASSRLRGSVAIAGRVVAGDVGEDSVTMQVAAGSAHSMAPWMQLSSSVDYRERVESPSRQDYRSVGGSVRTTAMLGDFDLHVGGGAELFEYKPLPTLSYAAPQMSLGVAWYPHDAWTWTARYSRAWRAFDEGADDGQPADGTIAQRRNDIVDLVASELRWSSGVVRLTAEWEMRINDSSVVERGYRRQSGTFGFAWVTWDDLLLTAQARVQRTQFDAAVYLDVSTNVDDEDRNSLTVALEYPVIDRLSVEARLVRLAQSLGPALEDYRRWVTYLGVGTSSRAR